MSTNIKNYDLDNPFFSVIMPIYNKEPYIERAVNSILNQKYQNFEIIIVCDPSTDNSNKIVDQLDDPRIRVFHRDKPGPGGYAARNLGIKHAKAEWICFLDADDIWVESNLNTAFELIKNNKNINLYCGSRVEVLDEEDVDYKVTKSSDYEIIGLNEYINYTLNGCRPNDSNSIIVNKRILETSDWFPDGKAERSGDLYLWIILLAHAKRMIYCKNTSSISFRYIVGVSKTALPSLSLNIELYEQLQDIVSPLERKFLRRYLNRLQTTAYFEHRRRFKKVSFYLSYLFFEYKDIPFIAKWLLISFLPIKITDNLMIVKARVKRILR